MTKQENLQRLFSPRSIVFIGGSNLAFPIQNTRDIGFDGEIWVVNPKCAEIADIPCFASIADLPALLTQRSYPSTLS